MNVIGATAKEIARAVRRGDVSATQVVADHLDHIHRHERELGAFRVIRDGEAVADTNSVATPEGAGTIVRTALDAYGKVDVLIHNAGNVRYGSIRELSFEDFQSVIDVHLMGAFYMVKAVHPLMCDAGYGRIVLTSSIGGIYGNDRCVNYGIAKSGMIGLNNVAALEGEAFGVKSNVIVPSAVTRMAEGLDISQYPPMEPELVAPAVPGWHTRPATSVSPSKAGVSRTATAPGPNGSTMSPSSPS